MSETIGQRLKKAREYRHLTLEKAADATRIRVSYLQAFETDDYSVMPSAAQGRGFLRNYAEYLGLNLDEVLAEIQRDQPETSEISGPLSQVNLTSQSITEEEPRPRPSRTSSLARRSTIDSVSEVNIPKVAQSESQVKKEPVSESNVPEAEPIKSRGRKKKDEKLSEPMRRGRSKKTKEEFVQIVEEKTTPKIIDEKEEEAGYQSVELGQTAIAAEAHADESKPSLFKKLSSIFKISLVSAQREEKGQAPVISKIEETKIEDASPVVMAEQLEVRQETNESTPSLLAKLTSIFKLSVTTSRPQTKEKSFVEPEVKVSKQPIIPTGPLLPKETAEEIFVSIGAELRKRRELISLTLDEVERHIHVRAVFLSSLEEGAFDKLPSPVQTRGMLANYATFLDLDTDATLLRFAEALQARHRQKHPELPRGQGSMDKTPSMPPLRSFIAGDLIFGVAMVVILIGLAIWGVSRIVTTQKSTQSSLPTAPSISDLLAGTLQPTVMQEVTFIPAADTPLAVTGTQDVLTIPTLGANVNVQVTIQAVERTYLRVSVDGKVVFDGRVLPGETYPYTAEEQVSILTGNAAALRVTYNGRDMGLMGNFGQVVSQIYTVAGLASPTPTVPPTATLTPKVTDTPTLTMTTTPSLETPTLTPTP